MRGPSGAGNMQINKNHGTEEAGEKRGGRVVEMMMKLVDNKIGGGDE